MTHSITSDHDPVIVDMDLNDKKESNMDKGETSGGSMGLWSMLTSNGDSFSNHNAQT